MVSSSRTPSPSRDLTFWFPLDSLKVLFPTFDSPGVVTRSRHFRWKSNGQGRRGDRTIRVRGDGTHYRLCPYPPLLCSVNVLFPSSLTPSFSPGRRWYGTLVRRQRFSVRLGVLDSTLDWYKGRGRTHKPIISGRDPGLLGFCSIMWLKVIRLFRLVGL